MTSKVDLTALEKVVFEAIGRASMCWENIEGAGEFNASLAVMVGDSLVSKILEIVKEEWQTRTGKPWKK